MGEFAIGQPVPRTEDPRLLTGRGKFLDDFTLPGQCHAAVLRSPHAHARIRSVDARAARVMPGVLAVLTGEDWAAEKFGHLVPTMPRYRRDGSPLFVAFANLNEPIVRRDLKPKAPPGLIAAALSVLNTEGSPPADDNGEMRKEGGPVVEELSAQDVTGRSRHPSVAFRGTLDLLRDFSTELIREVRHPRVPVLHLSQARRERPRLGASIRVKAHRR